MTPRMLSICLILLGGCAVSLRDPGRAPRDLAPDFELSDQRGQRQILSGLTDKGPVVLVFYRGHW